MNNEPQIKAWKWIGPPFIPLFTLVAESIIIPLCFGGWTLTANILTIAIIAGVFLAWYIGQSMFYKKHEHAIVAWELDIYKRMVKSREYFLANNKWPDEPSNEKGADSNGKTDDK